MELEFLVSAKVKGGIIVLILSTIKRLLSWTLRSISVQPNKIPFTITCYISYCGPGSVLDARGSQMRNRGDKVVKKL